MNDIQTLTLLPQDQLELINRIEVQAIQRYRCLALRFVTYDSVLSRQLSDQGIASQQHLESLKDVADRLGLGACVSMPDTYLAPVSFTTPDDRFFIIDEAMVNHVMQQAIAVAMETQSIARRLLGANGTPELEGPLRDYAHHKQREANVLMHCYAPHFQHD